MASRPVLGDVQNGFAGGFNGFGSQVPIPENQFVSMQNVRVVRDFEMAKRPGMRSLVSLTNAPISLNFWRADSTTAQIIVVDVIGTKYVGTFDPSTGAITLTSNIAVGDSSLGESGAHFVTGGADEFYLSSNSGKVYKQTASARLGASTPTGLNYLWVYNQRLFGCKTTDQTVYWSALNDGDTLGDTASGGGSATIRTFGGGVVRGGFALGSVNVIVHDSALSVFRGRTFDDISIQAGTEGLSADVGGIYNNSFRAIDGVGYVVSSKGLFTITEAEGVQPFERAGRYDPIAAMARTNWDGENVLIADNIRAGEIWFSMAVRPAAGQSATPTIYILNKRLGQFTGQITLPVGWSVEGLVSAGYAATGSIYPQIVLAIAGSSSHALAGCDFSDTTLEVFQDLGANYTSSVRCRRFFTGAPRNTKAFRRAYVEMGSGALGSASAGSSTGASLSYTTPVGGAVSDTTNLGAGATNIIQLSGQGQYVDVTLTDGGTSSTGWSVTSLEVEAFDYGKRGR